jgi:hypothetical protein
MLLCNDHLKFQFWYWIVCYLPHKAELRVMKVSTHVHTHTQITCTFHNNFYFLTSFFYTTNNSLWLHPAHGWQALCLVSYLPVATCGLCQPPQHVSFYWQVITVNNWVNRMARHVGGNQHKSTREMYTLSHGISFCGLSVGRKSSEYFSKYLQQNKVTSFCPVAICC